MPGASSLRSLATLSGVRVLSDFVLAGARTAGFSPEALPSCDLALEEALVNVVRYAYPPNAPGEIEILYQVAGDGSLEVRISDHGRPFNPLDSPAPNLDLRIAERPEGGLGIFLIRQIASSVTYLRNRDKNVLVLRFRNPAPRT